MPLGARFLKNFSWEFVGNFFNKMCWLVAVICLARVLGVELFGIYVIGKAYGYLLSLMAEGGLGVITTREIAKKEKHEQALFVGDVLVVRCVLLCIGFCLLAIVAFSAAPAGLKRQAIILMGFASFFEMSGDTWRAVFRGLQELRFSAFLIMGQSVVFLALVLWGTLFHYGLSFFLGSLVLSFLCMNVAGYYICRKKFFKPIIEIRKEMILSMLAESWPIAISGVLLIFYARMLPIFLDRFTTIQEAGFFGVAFNLSRNLVVVPVTLSCAVLPVFSQNMRGQDDGGAVSGHYRYLVKIIALFLLPVAIAVSFFSSEILRLIYGAAYMPAANCLIVLIWSVVIVSFAYLTKVYLEAARLQRVWTMLLTGTTFLVIVVGWFLVRRYGAFGASLTLGIAECLLMLTGLLVCARQQVVFGKVSRMPLIITGMKILVCVGIFFAILKIVSSWHFLVAIGCASIVYAGACWSLHVFKAEEKEEFLALLRRG